MIQASLLFSSVSIQTTELDMYNKSSEVFIKTRSPAASLAFKVTNRYFIRTGLGLGYFYFPLDGMLVHCRVTPAPTDMYTPGGERHCENKVSCPRTQCNVQARV